MARKRAKLSLSAEELSLLQKTASSRTAPVRRVERAKIILLIHNGKTNDEVVKELNVSLTMINNTRGPGSSATLAP